MKIDRLYTRNAVRVPRSATLAAAASMMREFHVGSLLVTQDPPDETNVVGFITDRDFVVQAMADELDTRELTVGDVMTPGVGTIPEDADLHEALEVMRAAGVRRLAVTRDGGAVVGVLSVDDVIDGLAADLASLAGLVKTEVGRESEEFGVRRPVV